jgi:pimeloyl-ACP methyl ester carboxylesterase
LNAPEPRYFETTDGLNLAYFDEGSGAPLLCLSGLTRNSSDFDYIRPHITGNRLIRLDYRGRGLSGFDPEYSNYNLVREATDVVELLDHLDLDQVAILGTSRGGLISMGLATTHKHRLSGVFLTDIGPVLEPAGLDTIMGYLGHRPGWKTLEEASAALPDLSVGFSNIPHERWRTEAARRWIEKPDGLHLRYDPKLRTAIEEASHGDAVDLWPFFDALEDLPLALVRGENSDLLSRETVAEMRRRRPDMTFAEVADRGHIPYLDEPESLTALARFLEEVA